MRDFESWRAALTKGRLDVPPDLETEGFEMRLGLY